MVRSCILRYISGSYCNVVKTELVAREIWIKKISVLVQFDNCHNLQ